MGNSSLEQNAKQFLQWEAIDAAALDSGKEMENILASILEKQTQDSLMLEKERSGCRRRLHSRESRINS